MSLAQKALPAGLDSHDPLDALAAWAPLLHSHSSGDLRVAGSLVPEKAMRQRTLAPSDMGYLWFGTGPRDSSGPLFLLY